MLRYMLETESLDAWEIPGAVPHAEGFKGGGGSDGCSVMGSPGKPQHFAAEKACCEELISLTASKIILVLPRFTLR